MHLDLAQTTVIQRIQNSPYFARSAFDMLKDNGDDSQLLDHDITIRESYKGFSTANNHFTIDYNLHGHIEELDFIVEKGGHIKAVDNKDEMLLNDLLKKCGISAEQVE